MLELAPLIVAVPFEQIVWLPPAAAVGNGVTSRTLTVNEQLFELPLLSIAK